MNNNSFVDTAPVGLWFYSFNFGEGIRHIRWVFIEPKRTCKLGWWISLFAFSLINQYPERTLSDNSPKQVNFNKLFGRNLPISFPKITKHTSTALNKRPVRRLPSCLSTNNCSAVGRNFDWNHANLTSSVIILNWPPLLLGQMFFTHCPRNRLKFMYFRQGLD